MERMNRTHLLNEIKNKLNYSDEQTEIIANIIDEVFFIGKNNREEIVQRYQDELNVSYEEADNIYNVTSEIIATSLKNSILHPFKSIDEE